MTGFLFSNNMKTFDQALALARKFPALAEETDSGMPVWRGQSTTAFDPVNDDGAIDAVVRRLDDEQVLDYVSYLLPPQCNDRPSFFGMTHCVQSSSLAKTAAALKALCLWKE